jgi:N6-L-threonylcarbamoyladenine synthase
MLVLGLETSCDETGVALYDTDGGLLAHALHSQVTLHAEYGGVVPELASRDHIRRLLPLLRKTLHRAGLGPRDIDAIAYTQGPGLAGALLVGAGIASGLGLALSIPVLGVHHMEAHLLSPLLSRDPPEFPFVALLVSGGHTQLMRVDGVGHYRLLGETLDDAAGEAFDKTAQLLDLGYPGGPALARLAESGHAGRHRLPRPMLASGELDFSFSGLKTSVLTLVRRIGGQRKEYPHIAAEFQEAVTDVLATKSVAALAQTGLQRLVVAGGVGANRRLREKLNESAERHGYRVYYPELEFCTDNGAMIALAGALRLKEPTGADYAFSVRPRWDMEALS